MDLGVCAEREAAVLAVVKLCPKHNLARIILTRNAALRGEGVEPEEDEVEELRYHDVGESSVREATSDGPHALLDDADEPLNVPDVLPRCRGVHIDAVERIAELCEFAVNEKGSGPKAARVIGPDNGH